MSKAPTEIKSLTGVRGAAAVVVMLYHFHEQLHFKVDHQHSVGLFSTVIHYGYLSVDLFFVLSGFVMAHVYGGSVRDGSFRLREFLGHRFARVYPLYALMTLTFAALAMLKSQEVPLAVLLSNLFMVQALGNWPSIDPPAWSVSVEAIAYLLFPLIAFLCLQAGRRTAMAVGVVALAAIFAMTVAAGRGIIGSPLAMGQLDLFFSPYTIVRCLAGFTLGQLVWRWRETRFARELASRDVVQAIVVVTILMLTMREDADFAIYLALIALILVLSTDKGVLPRLFGSPPFMWAGQLSLGIYLIHYKAFGLLDFLVRMLARADCPTVLRQPLAELLTAAAVIALSWVLHIAFERPARHAIRRWLNRGGSKAPMVRIA